MTILDHAVGCDLAFSGFKCKLARVRSSRAMCATLGLSCGPLLRASYGVINFGFDPAIPIDTYIFGLYTEGYNLPLHSP